MRLIPVCGSMLFGNGDDLILLMSLGPVFRFRCDKASTMIMMDTEEPNQLYSVSPINPLLTYINTINVLLLHKPI